MMFWPSTYPASRSPCRSASIWGLATFARMPSREIFPGCCASATEQSAKSKALSARPMTLFLMSFLQARLITQAQYHWAAFAFRNEHEQIIVFMKCNRDFGGMAQGIEQAGKSQMMA